MSPPWMPFYVRDHLADAMHLSTLEHGAYILLIMYYWLHEGLPSDDAKLARIVRLPLDQWMEIRPNIAEFFEPDWRHKRIEAELATAETRYQKRAAAGRQGGIASGQRRNRTNAEAMLPSEPSNAEAGPNQPQPQSQPQSQARTQEERGQRGDQALAEPDASDEERFWSRLDDLGKKGISRSRCTQLLKLNGGDFMEANRALDSAEQASKPGQYLGAIIRNLEVAGVGSPVGGNPHVPAWVNQLRAAGTLIERDGANSWRCLGEILNDAGEVVGF